MTGPDADRRAKSSSVLVPRPSALLREEAQTIDFGASQSIRGRSVLATEADLWEKHKRVSNKTVARQKLRQRSYTALTLCLLAR